MTLKMAKVKLPEMTLMQWKEKMTEHVEKVEEYKKAPKGQRLIRIKFKGLNPFGFIVAKEEEGSFVHYCEANEKKSSCSHVALAIVIGKELNITVSKSSIGAKQEEVHLSAKHTDEDYEELNAKLGLLTSIEEPEVEEEDTVSTPSVTPAKTSIPTTRDWRIGWNDIQDFLSTQGLNTRLIGKIQGKRKEVCDIVPILPMLTPPVKPKTPYEGPMLSRALRHVMTGKDLILIGGKGSGKDTMVSTIAWILGLPIGLQTGNRDETKESVVGENQYSNGKTEFIKSPFATTLEAGGLSYYAEVNMMEADVTSIFHSVLDENRVLASQIGAIPRNEHHLFIASMNVGEGYSGVKSLNDALKDRFAILRMPYTQDFKGLLEKKTGLTNKHALAFLYEVREAIKQLIADEGQGESADTLRGYIAAAEHFVEYGVDLDTKVEVIEDFIVNKVEDLDEYMAVRDAIRNVFKDFPKSEEEELYEKGAM